MIGARSLRAVRPPPLVLVAVALAGVLLFAVAANSHTAVRRAAEPRRTQLIALIQERRGQVEQLEKAVADLRLQITGAEQDAARRDASERAHANRTRELATLAGTVAMTGPGVEVHLSDSSRNVKPSEDPGAYRIHDRDLQLVVNALMAAGAEAVSVNGIRLVATSPIRSAGATIVVSFRPLSPPYTVRAIGADRAAFEGSDVARQFGKWRDLFGLGFKVHEGDELEVPAYTGRVRVSAASPA